MSNGPMKKPDIDGFRVAMQQAVPGNRHQNAVALKEALEIAREARARGVPWTTIGEGLEANGMCVTVVRLKKALSEENKRRIPKVGSAAESSADGGSESASTGTEGSL